MRFGRDAASEVGDKCATSNVHSTQRECVTNVRDSPCLLHIHVRLYARDGAKLRLIRECFAERYTFTNLQRYTN